MAFEPPPLPERENRSSNAGKNSALEQGSEIPQNWRPTLAKPLPATRCTAKVRNGEREGERCGAWAPPGSTVCNTHGYQLPVVQKKAAQLVEEARQHMLGLTPSAMDVIEEIMLKGTQEAVRLKAATEILDRAGIVKQAAEINVEVNHKLSQADEIQKRLNTIAERFVDQEESEDLGEILEEPLDGEEDAG